MEAAFDDNGFFGELRQAQGRFGIRRSQRSGRKHTGEVGEKPRVLQDVELEFTFRQGSLAQRHDEWMSQLRVPDRFGKLPQVISKGHEISFYIERRS